MTKSGNREHTIRNDEGKLYSIRKVCRKNGQIVLNIPRSFFQKDPSWLSVEQIDSKRIEVGVLA